MSYIPIWILIPLLKTTLVLWRIHTQGVSQLLLDILLVELAVVVVSIGRKGKQILDALLLVFQLLFDAKVRVKLAGLVGVVGVALVVLVKRLQMCFLVGRIQKRQVEGVPRSQGVLISGAQNGKEAGRDGIWTLGGWTLGGWTFGGWTLGGWWSFRRDLAVLLRASLLFGVRPLLGFVVGG